MIQWIKRLLCKDAQKTEIEAGQQWVMRCYARKYWQGDKERVVKNMAEYPQSMDLFKGYPEYGACGIDYEWIELRIVGDAYAELEVPANFGCPYWGD